MTTAINLSNICFVDHKASFDVIDHIFALKQLLLYKISKENIVPLIIFMRGNDTIKYSNEFVQSNSNIIRERFISPMVINMLIALLKNDNLLKMQSLQNILRYYSKCDTLIISHKRS